MASWLVRLTPERAVRLCSWAIHLKVTEPLSTQVYKWVPANLMLGGNPAMDWHPIQGGVDILSVASCYRNRDKLRPDGPLLARMQTLPYLTYRLNTKSFVFWLFFFSLGQTTRENAVTLAARHAWKSLFIYYDEPSYVAFSLRK